MFDSMISAVTDFVRGFLYGIAGAFMFVLDIIWEAIHKLVSLDLSDYLDNWFLLIMTLVGFFMLLRVGKIAMKIFFDEEYRMKFSFSNLMIKFFLASVMITMLPYAFSFCNKAMITMIDNMSAFIPYTATVTEETPGPSTGNDIADQFIDAFNDNMQQIAKKKNEKQCIFYVYGDTDEMRGMRIIKEYVYPDGRKEKIDGWEYELKR